MFYSGEAMNNQTEDYQQDDPNQQQQLQHNDQKHQQHDQQQLPESTPPQDGVISESDINLDDRDHEHEAGLACFGESDQTPNEEENVSADQDYRHQQQQLQQDDPNQQQQLQQDYQKHQQLDQQQLPRSTRQMITESLPLQDGVISESDINLDDRDHEHEAEACFGESDQTPNEEENVSADQDYRHQQQQLQQDDPNQQQQLQQDYQKHQQLDQQQLPRSTRQMITESLPLQDGVISESDINLDDRDHEHEAGACFGESDQTPNEEENVSADQDYRHQQQQLQQDDPNQQQQLQQDYQKHQQLDQQQLPRSTRQMITESLPLQDGVISESDINLDDRDHEHEAGACFGESDQTPNEEENVSADQDYRHQQQQLQQDDPNQQQQLQQDYQKHQQLDQQQLPRSTRQMITESLPLQDGVISESDINLDDRDHEHEAGACFGESDQTPNEEENVSADQDYRHQQQQLQQDDPNQQQQLQQDYQKHQQLDQQQLPRSTRQMITESLPLQDGVISESDINLNDRDHKHEAGACFGESDQTPNEEENVSADQQQGHPQCPAHPEYLHNDQTQQQQQGPTQQQHDQQQWKSQSSKPQMEKGLTPPEDQGITEEERLTWDKRSGGKGDKREPNKNRSGHDHQDNRVRGKHGKGGRSGACGYGKNEHPGRTKSGKDRQQKPNTYDTTYSDEEDDMTVQHADFEFFWLKKSPFSQWYPRKFIVGDHTFVTAEQFMMYQKAVIFQDFETAEKILNEKNPRVQQKLGRQAKNFNPQKWKEVCLEIVKTANMCKFSQNGDLKNHLFSTYPKTLVEASPFDRIWGIGRAASDPKAQTKETWLGHNLLGYALTDVRNEMMIKKGIIPMDAQTLLAECALIDIKNFDAVERFV